VSSDEDAWEDSPLSSAAYSIASVAGDRPEPAAPLMDGRFRLGPEIGSGGMGRVYFVHDRRLLRDVALKQGGWLLREARLVAQLEHPGIVPIYDMGFGTDGEPYFAMRIIRGRDLADVLATTPRGARAGLLRPLLQAAEAVAYAHSRGVVHRDLKPANIMIGDFGEVQVVDWGLARVLDDAPAPLPGAVRDALAGMDEGRLGTPGYMSPEQHEGRPADRRSDVYGLGRVLADVVGSDDTEPALSAIVAKCLARDPAERYPDAAAFAADLGRYLDGARVSAHAYGAGELLRRFVRAYRLPLALAAVAAVALATTLAVYVITIADERERAQTAEVEARAALARSDRYLARALYGEARRAVDHGDRAEAELLAAHSLALAEDPDARGVLSSLAGGPRLTRLDGVPLDCPGAQLDPVGEELLCVRPDGLALWGFADLQLTLRWRKQNPVRVAALVDGGVATATGGAGGGVNLFDRGGRLLVHAAAPNNPTAKVTRAGNRAVFETAKLSILADVSDRAIRGVVPCDSELHAALVPGRGDGPDLAAALCRDGRLIRGADTAQTALSAPEREGFRMALLPGGGVVVGTTKGEVVVLDRAGREIRSDHLVRGLVRVLAPSPDGALLAVAGEAPPVQLVTLPDLGRLASFPRRVAAATWDPAAPRELVTTGSWLERWRLAAPRPDQPLAGAYRAPLDDGVISLTPDPGAGGTLDLAFGPYVGRVTPTRLIRARSRSITLKGSVRVGPWVVAAGTDGLEWRDPTSLAADDERHVAFAIRRLASLSDGSLLLGTYGDVRRATDERIDVVDPRPAIDLAASADGAHAVFVREADRALLRLGAGETTAVTVGADPLAVAVATGVDESIYAAHRGEVAVWDASGGLVGVHEADDAPLISVAVAADLRWVAAGGRDGAVYLWRAGEPAPCARYADDVERVRAVAFGPEGRWLASGSWDRTLRFRDLDAVDAAVDLLIEDIAGRYALDLAAVLDALPRDEAD